jgi:hypothetical protein
MSKIQAPSAAQILLAALLAHTALAEQITIPGTKRQTSTGTYGFDGVLSPNVNDIDDIGLIQVASSVIASPSRVDMSAERDPCVPSVKAALEIWNETGFIFVHIPKNAGTAVEEAFNQQSHHIYISRYIDCGADTVRVPRIAIIRNPYERMVSMYAYVNELAVTPMGLVLPCDLNKPPLKSFPEFVACLQSAPGVFQEKTPGHGQVFNKQASYVLDVEGNNAVRHLLNMDNLSTEWAELQNEFSELPDLPSQPINPSSHGDWCDYYDEELAAQVADLYAIDFAAPFNYNKSLAAYC